MRPSAFLIRAPSLGTSSAYVDARRWSAGQLETARLWAMTAATARSTRNGRCASGLHDPRAVAVRPQHDVRDVPGERRVPVVGDLTLKHRLVAGRTRGTATGRGRPLTRPAARRLTRPSREATTPWASLTALRPGRIS